MTATPHAITPALDEAQRLTSAFHELLEAEARALGDRNSDRIAEIADEKLRLGARLEAALKPVPLSIPAGSTSDSTTGNDNAAIERLKQSLRELQDANRHNGQRVMMQNRQVTEALAVLQGQAGQKDGTTYGADGQARREGHGGRHVQV